MPQSTSAQRKLPAAPPVEISTVAARQHGVVTIAQLLAAGMSGPAVTRAVGTGRLHRVHRGVYAVGHPGLSREGRWSAAVLAAGDDAALSGLSAARFWDVSRWRTHRVHVVSTKRRRLDGVEVHTVRNLDPRDVLVHNGIRVTTVARMCVDLTDELAPHQLAYVIHQAEYRHIFSLTATEDAMERANGRRHLHVLERALELRAQGSAGTRSAKEDAFLAAQDREPLVNVKIEVDFHWPDEQRIVEVDGPHHDRPPTRRDDQRRDALLAADGWDVTRVRTR
ncbi:type IV toxin-antitoxin system AbiEi family antitoxin domain-containing protein [Solirubrobacter sp. CPCC 204708]|uniref:Type IV toxin-antitoxin system AbiEi family antitoxin domain-containing protein n=1 Tax=Solirubrobacter deserti TaxID=2282478 RepID=A0ABT4RHU1_9ACTN|nr:type IV toxin-antitoxin system AbiEi family antitoxin domain-containing protein [Solirubrobacter deserti]MBE2315177.1 type IV toxin-antitoxin system AbiEi family antitoxin domain-containing protein [Solirubrobacter deserti]MDA0137860.1 type IV toxin-antitoxin system AbiEi family antitoxin domain-containing protein [Solirubrobacter deserti]